MFDDLHPELWDIPKLHNIAPGYVIRVNRKHDNLDQAALFWHKGWQRHGTPDWNFGPAGKRMDHLDKITALGWSVAIHQLKHWHHAFKGEFATLPDYLRAALDENPKAEVIYKRACKGGLVRESMDVSICTWNPGQTSATAIAHIVDTGLADQTPSVSMIKHKRAAYNKFAESIPAYLDKHGFTDIHDMARHFSRRRDARIRIARRLKAGWPMDIYDANTDRLWHQTRAQAHHYGYWQNSSTERKAKLMEVQSRLPDGNFIVALMPFEQRSKIIRKFMEELG